MPFRLPLMDYMRRHAARWRRRRTERYINNLPAEIQKDIGWPSSYTPAGSGHRSSHSERKHNGSTA